MHAQLSLQTNDHTEFLDITDRVEEFVARSRVTEGLCCVYSPHTTAGLTINENADPDVRSDMLHFLTGLVPEKDPAYRHAEGNSAAHVKASLMGLNVTIPVEGGRLALGTWQGIYFCEFDGPRRRQVTVVIQAFGG